MSQGGQLSFSWAPSRTVDVTRLPYSAFLHVPKGYTAPEHRKYWGFPYRDEMSRINVPLLGKASKQLNAEGRNERNAIVFHKLETLVKRAADVAKRYPGANPASEWTLRQLGSGAREYVNVKTREKRAEVPAERRALPPLEYPPAPPRPPAQPAAPAPPDARARAKNRQGSPPDADGGAAPSGGGGGAGQGGRKRLRRLAVVQDEEDDDDEPPRGAGAAPTPGSGAAAGAPAASAQAAAAAAAASAAAAEEEEEEEEEEEGSDSDDSEEEEGSSSEEEDEGEEDDELARVLRKCEALSAKMRDALSGYMRLEGGAAAGGGADGEEESGTVRTLSGTEAPSVTPCDGLDDGAGARAHGRSSVLGQPPNMSSALTLKPYQLLGLNWLHSLHALKLNGILADEMGLGKTVQVISLLAHLAHRARSKHHRPGPFLIISPNSTVENWARELAAWCPALVALKYGGAEAERYALREELRAGARGEWHVLITSYSLFERDTSAAKEERAFLSKQRFEYAVLDEAHCIKNAASARFRNLSRLHTRHRLLLTGTPLENSTRELVTLLSFLMPSLIDGAVRERLLAADKSAAALAAVRSIMGPFVLRRLKAQVLSQLLLPRAEVTERVAMGRAQAEAYDGVLREHARRIAAARATGAAARAAAPGADAPPPAAAAAAADDDDRPAVPAALQPARASRREGGADDEAGPAAASALAAALASDRRLAKHVFTELRKAAQHPLLVRARYGPAQVGRIAEVLWRSGHFGDEATRARVLEEVSGYNDHVLHQCCAQHRLLHDLCLPPDALEGSAKCGRLCALLPELQAKGHRVVIFSQWTSVLDILQELLEQRLHLRHVRFDGSTNVDDRQLLIDEFSADESIFAFLLTTRAGGVGINLTAADTVILHDVDFNPAIDRQAQDRVHRIGQTRPVTVYRLVVADSVDEKILSLQTRKAELNDRVLAGRAGADADDEGSLCGSILADLLRERLMQPAPPAAADAGADADAPAADGAPAAAALPAVERADRGGGGGGGADADAAIRKGESFSAGVGSDAHDCVPEPAASQRPGAASPARAGLASRPASFSAPLPPAAAAAAGGAPPQRAPTAAAAPTDGEYLEELERFVPPPGSAALAAMTFKTIKAHFGARFEGAPRLSNQRVGELLTTLRARRAAMGAAGPAAAQ